MIRALLYALISIVAITFVRMVVGIITKGFSDMMREETAGSRPSTGGVRDVPKSGELKACATCGTYVVASQALTGSLKGSPVYYCSEKCRSGA